MITRETNRVAPRTKATGLNPSYLFSRRRRDGNRITSKPPATTAGSWWIGLSREALHVEGERRFTVNPPVGVVVNTKGVLDGD